MQKQLVATFIIIIIPFFFVSCVSSILKEKPPTFSQEIEVQDPAAPFVRMNTSVYPSWKNPQTGNVIAIISDCSTTSSYSLSSLHQLIENSLRNVTTVKEESSSLQGAPALRKTVNGELDTRPIEVRSISFQKKSCSYVSSLSGKKDNLEADSSSYEQFLSNLSFK